MRATPGASEKTFRVSFVVRTTRAKPVVKRRERHGNATVPLFSLAHRFQNGAVANNGLKSGAQPKPNENRKNESTLWRRREAMGFARWSYSTLWHHTRRRVLLNLRKQNPIAPYPFPRVTRHRPKAGGYAERGAISRCMPDESDEGRIAANAKCRVAISGCACRIRI